MSAMDHDATATRGGADSRAGIFARFLRFGLLAWGGPVVQIAMLRRELVEEEHWISGDRFNRLLAVYQVLPGPEAHELAVHLGFLRGGRIGALLAGLGFMLPGFVLMFALSWLYFQIDLTQAAIGAALLGAQIAVIALVVRAVQQLGQHVLASPGLILIGLAGAIATLAGVPFWVTLPVGGAAHALASRMGRASGLVPGVLAAVAVVALAWSILANGGLVLPGSPGPNTHLPIIEPSIVELFVSGLKAGLLTFGGAYTAIPFLRGDAVGRGWIADTQFLDGIALAGVIPAPLIIFSTFVGYVGGGPLGALAMTAGVFLPAFSFSLLFGDRIEAVIDHPALRDFLAGVAAAVVGLIAITGIELGLAVVARVPSLVPGGLIFMGALAILLIVRSKAAIPAVVGGAALAGWLAFDLLAR